MHFCPQFVTLETRRRLVTKYVPNRLFPICLKPLFQSEVKCEAIDMKMIFDYNANKTHLHNKGFSLSLVLKVRFFGNRKWFLGSLLGTHRSAIGLISYPDLPRVKQSEIWVRDYHWTSFSLSLVTVPEVIATKKKTKAKNNNNNNNNKNTRPTQVN